MASFRLLLDMPSVPRLLQLLMDAKEGRTESSLAQSLPDETHLTKAVSLLLDRRIVTREQDLLKLVDSGENLRTVSALIQFYRDIQNKARKQLLFRGILNTTQYRCLVHFDTFLKMMEEEGFGRWDVEEVLRSDKQQGLVEQLKIMYRSRNGVKHKFFPFIPLYYYPHFVVMNGDRAEHFKERLEGTGITLTQEDYLLGSYPKEIARQSRDYIFKEKDYIREKIKNEAFDIWWYYRF